MRNGVKAVWPGWGPGRTAPWANSDNRKRTLSMIKLVPSCGCPPAPTVTPPGWRSTASNWSKRRTTGSRCEATSPSTVGNGTNPSVAGHGGVTTGDETGHETSSDAPSDETAAAPLSLSEMIRDTTAARQRTALARVRLFPPSAEPPPASGESGDAA